MDKFLKPSGPGAFSNQFKSLICAENRDSGLYLGLLILFLSLIAWAFVPGHTDYDTINMLEQARTRVFNDGHSPAVEAIWFLLGARPWVIAATLILTLGSAAFFIYKLFRLAEFSHREACVFTILTCYTPPVLGMLGCVCKDTWVAVLFLGTLYFTICHHRRPSLIFIALRDATLVAAILVRPEFALIAILFLFLEFLFTKASLALSFRRFILNGVAVVAGYLGLNGAAFHLEHATKVHPETFLYLSDLIDLSVAENQLLIPAYYLNGSDLGTIREHYRYPDVNNVFYGPNPNLTVHWPMPEQEFLNLRHVWRHEVWTHPGRCLEHRLSTFQVYLWNGAYFSSIIDPNDEGLHIYHKSANDFFVNYLSLFRQGLLQRHFFSVLGCPALIFLLIKFAPEGIYRKWLIAGLICAFFYQLEFSVIGFPAYWRFGSAGVIVFWIGFYVVARDLMRSGMQHERE